MNLLQFSKGISCQLKILDVFENGRKKVYVILLGNPQNKTEVEKF